MLYCNLWYIGHFPHWKIGMSDKAGCDMCVQPRLWMLLSTLRICIIWNICPIFRKTKSYICHFTKSRFFRMWIIAQCIDSVIKNTQSGEFRALSYYLEFEQLPYPTTHVRVGSQPSCYKSYIITIQRDPIFHCDICFRQIPSSQFFLSLTILSSKLVIVVILLAIFFWHVELCKFSLVLKWIVFVAFLIIDQTCKLGQLTRFSLDVLKYTGFYHYQR